MTPIPPSNKSLVFSLLGQHTHFKDIEVKIPPRSVGEENIINVTLLHVEKKMRFHSSEKCLPEKSMTSIVSMVALSTVHPLAHSRK